MLKKSRGQAKRGVFTQVQKMDDMLENFDRKL
jgi:hypothetical protein